MIYLLFLRNLFVTVAVEGLIILALFRSWKTLYTSILGNLLTNPLLNLLLLIAVNVFGRSIYPAALIILETAAILAEALIFRLLCFFGWKKSLTVSLLLNLASFSVGLLLN